MIIYDSGAMGAEIVGMKPVYGMRAGRDKELVSGWLVAMG